MDRLLKTENTTLKGFLAKYQTKESNMCAQVDKVHSQSNLVSYENINLHSRLNQRYQEARILLIKKISIRGKLRKTCKQTEDNPDDLQSWIFLLFVYMNYFLHEDMQDFRFCGMSGSRFWLFSYSIPLSLSLCYPYTSHFVYEFDINISLNQWLMVWSLSLAILLLLIKFWRVFKCKISIGC